MVCGAATGQRLVNLFRCLWVAQSGPTSSFSPRPSLPPPPLVAVVATAAQAEPTAELLPPWGFTQLPPVSPMPFTTKASGKADSPGQGESFGKPLCLSAASHLCSEVPPAIPPASNDGRHLCLGPSHGLIPLFVKYNCQQQVPTFPPVNITVRERSTEHFSSAAPVHVPSSQLLPAH